MNGELKEAAWIIFAAVAILGAAIMMHNRYQPIGNTNSLVLDTMTGKVFDPYGKPIIER